MSRHHRIQRLRTLSALSSALTLLLALAGCDETGGAAGGPTTTGTDVAATTGDASAVDATAATDGGVANDTNGADTTIASDTASADDTTSADDAALPPDGGTTDDAGSDDAGSDDAGSDDAGSDDTGNDDAGSDDAGNSDASDDAGNPAPKAPTVKVEQQADAWICTIDTDAPAAGATLLYAWQMNEGAWIDSNDGDAKFPGEASDCDLLRCRLNVTLAGDASLSATSAAAELQLPMGAACATANVCAPGACKATGGCAAPPVDGVCDDGDPCTSGEACAAGACKAPVPIACTNYFADDDSDKAGGKALGCFCVSPDAAAVTIGGDCDDSDANALPGGTETCDGVDQNCDGKVDEGACGALLPPEAGELKTDAPMTGDSYKVGASATMTAGAFGQVAFSGTIEKSGPDAAVTFCMSGPATLPKDAPLQLVDATLTVCKAADGSLTRTIKGTLQLDGTSAAITGSYTLGNSSGSKPTVKLDAAKLALLGIDATAVKVVWVQGDKTVTVSGLSTLDYLDQTLAISLAGALAPAADAALTLTLATPTAVLTVGGVVSSKASAGSGERIRKGGRAVDDAGAADQARAAGHDAAGRGAHGRELGGRRRAARWRSVDRDARRRRDDRAAAEQAGVAGRAGHGRRLGPAGGDAAGAVVARRRHGLRRWRQRVAAAREGTRRRRWHAARAPMLAGGQAAGERVFRHNRASAARRRDAERHARRQGPALHPGRRQQAAARRHRPRRQGAGALALDGALLPDQIG